MGFINDKYPFVNGGVSVFQRWFLIGAMGAFVAGCGGGSGDDDGNGGDLTENQGDVIRHAEALLSGYEGSYQGADDWAEIILEEGDVWETADAAYVSDVFRVLLAEINRFGGRSVMERAIADPEEAFNNSEPCPDPGSFTVAEGSTYDSGSATFDGYCWENLTLSHPGPYVLNGSFSWERLTSDSLLGEWDTIVEGLEVEWLDKTFVFSGVYGARDRVLASAYDIGLPAGATVDVLRVLYSDSGLDEDWDKQVFHPALGKFRSLPSHPVFIPCEAHFNASFAISSPTGASFDADANDATQCHTYLVNGEDSSGAIMAQNQPIDGWLGSLLGEALD